MLCFPSIVPFGQPEAEQMGAILYIGEIHIRRHLLYKGRFFLLSVVCMCSKQPPVVLHHHFHGWMHQARWCSTFYIIREITSYNMWLFLYLSITETKSVIDGLKVLPFGVY